MTTKDVRRKCQWMRKLLLAFLMALLLVVVVVVILVVAPPTWFFNNGPEGRSKKDANTTVFYAIGDVPYNRQQAIEIEAQLRNIPSDADFVIHVGDLRNHDENHLRCRREEYELASRLFQQSPVPVLVILGDNECVDCSNPRQGLQYWYDEMAGFESKHWNHSISMIRRGPDHPHNFAFVHKKTLFIGLNMVGSPMGSAWEWRILLMDEFQWVRELILSYLQYNPDTPNQIVLFGHANPKPIHNDFFDLLDDLIQTTLNDSVPILYLNGDKHEWSYDPQYRGHSSMLRIMLTGGSSELPVRVAVHATYHRGPKATTNRTIAGSFWNTFHHDRQLVA